MNKKIFSLFFVLFLSAIVFIPCANAKSNLAAHFYVGEGKKEFKAKNYDIAIIDFQKALLADPDNEEALMYIKILGASSKGPQGREQDPIAKDKKADHKKKETKKDGKSHSKKESPKDTQKKIAKKSSPAVAVKSETKSKAKSINAESEKSYVSSDDDEDQVLNDIEEQIAKEEATALKAVRDQAALDQEVLLKKTNKTKTPAKKPTAKTVKSTKKKPAAKTSKSATDEVTECPPCPEGEKKSVKPEVSDALKSKKVIAEEAATEKIDTQKNLEAIDQSAVETESELEPEPVSEPILEKPVAKPVAKSKSSSTVGSLPKSTAMQPSSLMATTASPQSREAAVVTGIKKEAAAKKAELREKIDEQTAKKIEIVHAKFEGTPIGKKEKTIFRDVDNDGVPEAVSVAENKALEKVEVQANKEQQAGYKKIDKEAAQDEKIAIKKLRAKIKNEEKLKGRGRSVESESNHVKAGDIVVSEEDVVIPDVSSEDSDNNMSMLDDADLSPKEAAVLVDMKSDLAQKEKDIEMKYAKKKAMRMSEADKKARPQVQETKAALMQDDERLATNAKEMSTEKPLDRNIPAANPKSVQAQNVVLKKKFSQVVEMAQKDQELIKDLESNVAEKDQKVEALQGDLHETKTNLDSKVVLIKAKEEKLKGLSDKIAAMESDLNSKQYDFKDKQIEYEKKLQAIQEEFGNYKSERANTEEQLKEQLNILKLALEKKIAELNAAQEKLIFTENKLKSSEEKYVQTTKQYDDVKKTMADLEDRLGRLSAEPLPALDQAPLVAVDPQNLPVPQNQNEVAYQQWIKRQDFLVTKLKDKLLWAREQMEFLGRYDIKLSDQRMAALKEQLVAVKKQLSAQVPTGRTDEDFALMEGRFKDSQERLDMVEKILLEKDDQVKELEKQLNQVLSAF